MTQQFTASEVRELAATIWPDLSGREEVAETLHAFADLLEAREKAKPVMIVNHVSSAEHDLPIGMKLYTHPAPSNAERLAEALGEGDFAAVAQWKEWIEEGKRAYLKQESAPGHLPRAQESINFSIAYALRKLRTTLAAHSAQAQSPAASVTDEYQEIARLIGSIFCAGGFKAETWNERELERLLKKTGNWFDNVDQVPKPSLAAQENPND